MSVTGPMFPEDLTFRDEIGALAGSAIGHVCFYCAKRITADPALVWRGPGEGPRDQEGFPPVFHLYLHRRTCFERFFLALARDAWEIDHPACFSRERAGFKREIRS